jgi:hypothetical protein
MVEVTSVPTSADMCVTSREGKCAILLARNGKVNQDELNYVSFLSWESYSVGSILGSQTRMLPQSTGARQREFYIVNGARGYLERSFSTLTL